MDGGTKREAMQNIAKAGIKDRSKKKLSPKFKLEMLQTKFVTTNETSGDLLHNMDSETSIVVSTNQIRARSGSVMHFANTIFELHHYNLSQPPFGVFICLTAYIGTECSTRQLQLVIVNCLMPKE